MGEHSIGAPAEPEPGAPRAQWSTKRLVLLASAISTVIAVLAIVVPLAVTAGDRVTDVRAIEVDSQPASDDGEGLTADAPDSAIESVTAGLSVAVGDAASTALMQRSDWFAVPVTAPWEELYATPGACTTEIFDWLEAHGKPMLPEEITAQISNTATTGSDATISRIRPQGTLTPPPVETVRVGAMGCRGGGDEGVYATMALGVDPVAVYDDCYSPSAQYSCVGAAEAPPIAGDPVIFTVAPGETRTLHLRWTQTTDFIGRFVADLTIDGATSTIDLSPDGADLDVPVVTRADAVLYFGIDGPWCEIGGMRTDSCDLGAWQAAVAG